MTRQRGTAVLVLVLAMALSTGTAAAFTVQDGDARSNGAASNVAQASGSTITFENQTSEGRNVTVQSVNLTEGGFVALHTTELLNGSVLGSVVGTSEYLEPGEHEDVTIELNESVDESATLIAVAYQDTNANREFDFVETQGSADGAYVVNNQVVADAAEVTLGEAPAAETTEAVETTALETTEAPTTQVETTEEIVTEVETTELATEIETTEAETETAVAEIGTETTEAVTQVETTAEPITSVQETEGEEEPDETSVAVETTEAVTTAPETGEEITEVGTTEELTEVETTGAGATTTANVSLPEETPSGVGGALSPGQPGFGPLAALAGLAGGAMYLFGRRREDQ